MIKEHRWSLILTYLGILAVAIYGAVSSEINTRDLRKQANSLHTQIDENKARIREIGAIQKAVERNRIESCRHTYEGIREVFKPFFRPPNKQTPKERADQKKLNDTIDSLKAQCTKQVKPKKPKEKKVK